MTETEPAVTEKKKRSYLLAKQNFNHTWERLEYQFSDLRKILDNLLIQNSFFSGNVSIEISRAKVKPVAMKKQKLDKRLETIKTEFWNFQTFRLLLQGTELIGLE